MASAAVFPISEIGPVFFFRRAAMAEGDSVDPDVLVKRDTPMGLFLRRHGSRFSSTCEHSADCGAVFRIKASDWFRAKIASVEAIAASMPPLDLNEYACKPAASPGNFGVDPR